MNTKDFLEDSEVIDIFSRHEALSDGLLVDLSSVAREVGIRYPLAVTSSAYNQCLRSGELEELGDERERSLDLVHQVATLARAGHEEPEIHFEYAGSDAEPVLLKVRCHSGDFGEPVLTIMQAGED